MSNTRECLTLKVDRSITSEDLIDTLAELFAMRVCHGTSAATNASRRCHGPEFIARAIQRWTKQLSIDALYVEPGSPWENGYAESFHSRLVMSSWPPKCSESLAAARKLTITWRNDYNHHRPHSSLGYVAPAEFAARCAASVRATPSLQQHSGSTLIPS